MYIVQSCVSSLNLRHRSPSSFVRLNKAILFETEVRSSSTQHATGMVGNASLVAGKSRKSDRSFGISSSFHYWAVSHDIWLHVFSFKVKPSCKEVQVMEGSRLSFFHELRPRRIDLVSQGMLDTKAASPRPQTVPIRNYRAMKEQVDAHKRYRYSFVAT